MKHNLPHLEIRRTTAAFAPIAVYPTALQIDRASGARYVAEQLSLPSRIVGGDIISQPNQIFD